MSANDFAPWTSHMGGHIQVAYAPMNAGETFRVGELVSINADGELTESVDDPVPMDFAGIALAPAGYSISGTAVSTNPMTGANFTTGDPCPYVKALPGQQFITANFATAGGGVTVMPLAYATAYALIGEAAGASFTSDVWFVDSGGTGDRELFRIEGFLDAQKTNILWSRAAAAYVIVTVVQSQWTPITDAAGSLVAIA